MSDSASTIHLQKKDWSECRLHLPHKKFEKTFIQGLRSLTEKSEKLGWVYLGDFADLSIPEKDFSSYVDGLLKREKNPPPGFVCDTSYWAIYKGQMVGRISIRHELNEFLKEIGGHIGYIVHPAWRKKGIATWMLGEILKTDRAKQIRRLLLTCDENNEASRKTILANGGVFAKTVPVREGRPKKMHFWILSEANTAH